MQTQTGKIDEIANFVKGDKPYITELMEDELIFIKQFREEFRPLELASFRFEKKHTTLTGDTKDIATRSFRDGFIEGRNSK